jgi:hypothetical protein
VAAVTSHIHDAGDSYMVKCKKCGQEIGSGEKIVVQYEGTMMYERNEATPTKCGTYMRCWHKRCKPWHE